jgi:hypothetical protein
MAAKRLSQPKHSFQQEDRELVCFTSPSPPMHLPRKHVLFLSLASHLLQVWGFDSTLSGVFSVHGHLQTHFGAYKN